MVKMKEPGNFELNRNLFIWNDRVYFTFERDYLPGVHADEFKDTTLDLYSTAMDGRSDKRKEHAFVARATYDLFDEYGNREAGADNLSVLYDHSTIYYFNKKGVFKYSLLDKKTSKLSNILGKRIEATDTELIITDINGKKHTLKK
ncbi:hypothetical protein AB1K83_05580 [Sporosarcina sp. 179-K 3D1 HS]|uniref:hypothetical protein n=1 Tax=Sporosarcina sp. 179-K 3D1 HS TaxID=3232169 RepID=UPI00399F9C2B